MYSRRQALLRAPTVKLGDPVPELEAVCMMSFSNFYFNFKTVCSIDRVNQPTLCI